MKTLTFLLFIGVLLLINLFGNRVIKWANGTSTVGKVFALSVFIVGGFWSRLTARKQLCNVRIGGGLPPGTVLTVRGRGDRANHRRL